MKIRKKPAIGSAYWCSTEAFILEFGVQVLAYRRRAGPGWEFLFFFWIVSQMLVIPIVDGYIYTYIYIYHHKMLIF